WIAGGAAGRQRARVRAEREESARGHVDADRIGVRGGEGNAVSNHSPSSRDDVRRPVLAVVVAEPPVSYSPPPGMPLSVFPDHIALARAAARDAASRIRTAVAVSGHARIVAATGTSQMTFLDRLTREADLDWSRVELFHLDEYVGLPDDHPASFRKYLRE